MYISFIFRPTASVQTLNFSAWACEPKPEKRGTHRVRIHFVDHITLTKPACRLLRLLMPNGSANGTWCRTQRSTICGNGLGWMRWFATWRVEFSWMFRRNGRATFHFPHHAPHFPIEWTPWNTNPPWWKVPIDIIFRFFWFVAKPQKIVHCDSYWGKWRKQA